MGRCYALLLLFGLSSALVSQPRVAAADVHERLLCIVPLVGSGTFNDPRRPLFAPARADRTGSGIIAYRFEESDDGNFALVEFVARERKAFAAIPLAGGPNIKVFQKGRHSRADILTEFRKYKRSFDADEWAAGASQ